MVRDQRQRDYNAIRVCYRMAPGRSSRARRIAGGIRHTLMKPYALGVMAQALARSETTRPVAAELLAAAFDELARSVDAGTDPFNSRESAAVTAASLLPVAEAIDPALVPEYLWRSVSYRRPGPGPESDPSHGRFLDAATAVLAMRIARYDPATAGALLEPVARRLAADPNGTCCLGRPRDRSSPWRWSTRRRPSGCSNSSPMARGRCSCARPRTGPGGTSPPCSPARPIGGGSIFSGIIFIRGSRMSRTWSGRSEATPPPRVLSSRRPEE